MPTVKAGEVNLCYEEFGTGHEPLVLVHGWTGTRRNWRAMIDCLPLDRLRVFALDMRGAGGSDRPSSGFEAWQMADDVATAMENLGVSTFHYAGHSMGGLIGMHMALRHPQRLRRLILVAPAPADGALALDPDEQFYHGMAAVNHDIRQHHEFVLQNLSVRPVPPAFVDSLISEEELCSQEHLDQCWDGFRPDISADLASIKTETLMIAADRDFVLPFNLRDYARIPNCALHVFYRVGHMLSWEVPTDLASVMVDFIKNGSFGLQEVEILLNSR